MPKRDEITYRCPKCHIGGHDVTFTVRVPLAVYSTDGSTVLEGRELNSIGEYIDNECLMTCDGCGCDGSEGCGYQGTVAEFLA